MIHSSPLGLFPWVPMGIWAYPEVPGYPPEVAPWLLSSIFEDIEDEEDLAVSNPEELVAEDGLPMEVFECLIKFGGE